MKLFGLLALRIKPIRFPLLGPSRWQIGQCIPGGAALNGDKEQTAKAMKLFDQAGNEFANNEATKALQLYEGAWVIAQEAMLMREPIENQKKARKG